MWAALIVWAGVSGWNHVHRVDAMPASGNRPTAGSGTNYVLVGSDSRVGLTKAQRKELATGTAVGQRTDSIMLVHLPAGGGEPTLVSLPRDSYVPIPGHGSNKINAAVLHRRPPAADRAPSSRSAACTSTATSRSASAASPPSSTAWAA